ncbi:unnamed protein product [Calicophoron daubneyi]|uniref:Uncharacterized protein n=1 Tax=Calicophoron daubneyi TaxID=300641 RepID=A0AAV2T2K2_CALDB
MQKAASEGCEGGGTELENDLNTNSKRVALEVFELSKRKKSVSKGRTELLLSDLLNAGPVPEPEGDVWGTSEHRRRLTLSSTGSTLSTSTTGAPSSPNPSLSSGGLSGGAHSPCPTVTAEFHFMEKSMEDPLMSRQRAAVSNAFGVHRVLPSHDWLQSASAQDSPILGPAAVTTGPISHSTSLDFPQTKYVPVRRAEVVVEGEVVGDLGPPASASPVIRSEEKIATATITTAGEADQPVEGPRNLRAGELSPPIQSLRAQIEVLPTSNTSAFSASISRSPQAQADSGTDTQTLVGQTKKIWLICQPPVEAGNGGSSSSDRLSRTDSLIKRSQLIGADETSVHSRQALLPYPDSDFDITKDGSDPTVAASGSVLRSHSLANRLKSSRLLPSGMRSGKRSSEDSTMGGSASLALLGPSRQLAGVVASLSTLPTDPGTSPISAAALASAVAVAGATGSWQQPPGVENYDRFGRGTPSTSSVKSKSAENDADTLIPSPAQAAPPEPPVRYMPPAASVAADSPGTYTAQTQHPRRSDGSNLSLFRLFRHKKKRFRSAGPEKLLYLDNSDLEDFDAISTEGYYRIVQDPDPRPQMQHPNR